MKKIFQFACVAVIAASFVACGLFGGTTADGADSTAVVEVSETVVVDTTACETAKACDSTAVVK